MLKQITKRAEKWGPSEEYPFHIPALRHFQSLHLNKQVTFFVGENGSGKSTLLEAIAYQCGFNTAGGSRNNSYHLESSESILGESIRLSWLPKITQGFFLRAESFYQFANHIDDVAREEGSPAVYNSYGGKSLHQYSHGESFFKLFQHRFGRAGIYLLDEPEAALSPSRQLMFLSMIHELQKRAQLIIATHSPILLGYPHADIYQFSDQGVQPIAYEMTDTYQVTRRFLENRQLYLRELLD